MFFELFTNKFPNCNLHYLQRYIKFIESRKNIKIINMTHLHHILPKSKDMFPEFKNLKDNQWNGINLTLREHYIAHWLLHKTFKGSSQSNAFFHMTNIIGKRKSKDYALAKEIQQSTCRLIAQNPERNLKISNALLGKPKSEEHKKKLGGPRTEEEKANISRGVLNSEFKFSDEQRKQMSLSRTGKTKAKNTIQSKLNIAKSKCEYYIITPIGVFESHLQAAIAYKITPRRFVLIYRNLDIVPRTKVLKELNLDIRGKTYKELGFDKMPK